MTGSCEIFYGYDQPEQAWMHLMSLSHRLFHNLDVLNEPEMVHFFMARSHTHIKLTKVLHQVEENLKTENL